jgi:hypothetical protein
VRTPSYSVVVGTGHRWWSSSPMHLPQDSCRLFEITIHFLGFPCHQGEIWSQPGLATCHGLEGGGRFLQD